MWNCVEFVLRGMKSAEVSGNVPVDKFSIKKKFWLLSGGKTTPVGEQGRRSLGHCGLDLGSGA